MVGKYKVITLCGSTRSEIEYAHAAGKTVRYLKERNPGNSFQPYRSADT